MDIYSFYAKPGTKNWMVVWSRLIENSYCYFNIKEGTIGTIGTNIKGFIDDCGNGFYRCGIIFPNIVDYNSIQTRFVDNDNELEQYFQVGKEWPRICHRDKEYNDTCPYCGAAAYIGLNNIECSKNCNKE